MEPVVIVMVVGLSSIMILGLGGFIYQALVKCWRRRYAKIEYDSKKY